MASNDFRSTLESARNHLGKNPWDAQLSVYMMRDFEITRTVELSDFAWAVCREGYCTKSEAEWFLNELERRADELDAAERARDGAQK